MLVNLPAPTLPVRLRVGIYFMTSFLASPFQLGFAVAAGLGCGAALLYGNRLFAVEVRFIIFVIIRRIKIL